MLKRSIGIDTLLFDPWLVVETATPGRMARNTAICFTVLGGTALWFAVSGRRARHTALALGTAGSLVAGVALVALFGYASNVSTAYAWRTSTAMAPTTASALLLLGIGYVAAAWGAATSTGSPRWLPIPVAVGALATTLFLWQALTNLGDDARTVSLDRAAGSVFAVGLVFSALLAGAVALGQDARRRRHEAESLTDRLADEVALRGARVRRDEVLAAAYRAVSSERDLSSFGAFAATVADALPYDRVSLSFVEGPSARIVAVAGPRAHTLPVGSRLPVTSPVVAEMVATREPYISRDSYSEVATACRAWCPGRSRRR